VVDLLVGMVRGRHVVLQRAAAAGLPAAFRDVLADVRPSIVVLGQPFFGPFIDHARAAGALVIVEADESLDRVNRSVLASSASLSQRARALADLVAVRAMERRDLRRADQIWAGSEIESAALTAHSAGAPVIVVPTIASVPSEEPPPPGPLNAVGFVGWFAHPPNQAAALELIGSIMPAIRAAGGPRRLMLIGRDPTARMRRAAAGDPDIEITGAVDDPAISLRAAGVLVMPVRAGGGTRVKALNAIAAGVPIVSTAFGVEGFNLRPGTDVLIAESPPEFANAVRHLENETLRTELASNAREAIARTHSLPALRAAIADALSQLLPQER